MTNNRSAALAATAEALAAVDPQQAADFAAARDAEVAEIDAALERAQEAFTAAQEAVRLRERGIGVDAEDQRKAAAALLAGEDVVEAIEPLEVLTARKDAIAAGMRGLRDRRAERLQHRDDGRERLRGSLGVALAPLEEELDASARQAVAALVAAYADVVTAASCGNNGVLSALGRSLADPLARLMDAGLADGVPLVSSPDLLDTLKVAEQAMKEARRGPPSEIRRPTVERDHNPYLLAAGAEMSREALLREQAAA